MDKAKDVSIKRMVSSKDGTNQRFINMLRIQHAQRHGVKIGFKRFDQSEHKPKNMAENQDKEFDIQISSIGSKSFKDNQNYEESKV